MTFIQKYRRNKLFKKVKRVLLHAPERRIALWGMNEDKACCIYKATENEVWLTEISENMAQEAFNRALQSPFAKVELSGDMQRDYYIIEEKLMFKTYYDENKQEYFDSMFKFVNDNSRVHFFDADTFGPIFVIKRNDGFIDIGYIDSLVIRTETEMPIKVTRTVPLEEDREKTTNFIIEEMEDIMFFKYNPKTGDVPNE